MMHLYSVDLQVRIHLAIESNLTQWGLWSRDRLLTTLRLSYDHAGAYSRQFKPTVPGRRPI